MSKRRTIAFLSYWGCPKATRAGLPSLPTVPHGCPSIIIVHNHPSGDPTPSPEDIIVTRQVREGGKMMDIELLDHVIIGGQGFVSLKDKGLGF